MHQPLELRCDGAALSSNYRYLEKAAGTATGAAVKADGYGLGARDVARRLLDIGCRDFFVSSWWEAAELDFLPPGSLAVLHGYGPQDQLIEKVRPVLISAEQVERWKARGRSEPCDVMVDTGMNRLGLALDEISSIDGLDLHTLHSHLACADDDHALNDLQLKRFTELRGSVKAQRYSLANSAGILLGQPYAFDLVRPGLALYGGIPRAEARDHIRQVAHLRAQVLQVRTVRAGESIGYNATYRAEREIKAAVINIGYADGYWRGLSSKGVGYFEGERLPVLGRVSMDLVTLDATSIPTLKAGDWIELDFDLERSAALSGMSQYELLTGLGQRYRRSWT